MANRPSKEELEEAMQTCIDYAAYLRETKPRATRSIDILEEAADEFYIGVTYYDDPDFNDEDEDSLD